MNALLDLPVEPNFIVTTRAACMMLVNGGLPTKYFRNTKIDEIEFFFFCKNVCAFVECLLDQKFCMLSLTAGVPMRPVRREVIEIFLRISKKHDTLSPPIYLSGEVDEYYFSPVNMKNTFLKTLRKYFNYCIPAKVHSVYTYNNRFVANNTASPYYDLTC